MNFQCFLYFYVVLVNSPPIFRKTLIQSFFPCEVSPEETSLKEVGNEKGGGSGEWLLFEDGFRPWRSMSVYCLMLPSSFLQHISVSCM